MHKTRNSTIDSHLIARLPDVLLYLRTPSLWAVLLGLAIISAVVQALSFGLAALFVAGLEIGVFFQITRSSAQGDRTLEAPDFLSVYDNIVHPIILVVIAALPMLVAGYWATTEVFSGALPHGSWPIGPLALFLIGLTLYPLLLTIAAIDRDPMREPLYSASWCSTFHGCCDTASSERSASRSSQRIYQKW